VRRTDDVKVGCPALLPVAFHSAILINDLRDVCLSVFVSIHP
jgi:hypothetical protein